MYSFGADGIDDRGDKDDIASWRSVDRGYYPSPPIRLDELLNLLVPATILLMLIGLPAWSLWRRRKLRIAKR